MTKLSRREAVMRVGLLMGGVLSAPALSLLNGCQPKKNESTIEGEVFASDQVTLITTVCGLIIPTTNTPGAIEAGVPGFVTRVIAECYPEEYIQRFKEGLKEIDKEAENRYDGSFLELSENEQLELLTSIEKEGKSVDKKLAVHEALHMLKELTLVGYFTSEIGATEALQYEHVPGAYNGCMDMEPNQKTWATS